MTEDEGDVDDNGYTAFDSEVSDDSDDTTEGSGDNWDGELRARVRSLDRDRSTSEDVEDEMAVLKVEGTDQPRSLLWQLQVVRCRLESKQVLSGE